MIELRRDLGMPYKILIGQRGRLRKEFNMIGLPNKESISEEADIVFLAEYLMLQALLSSELDE